MRIFHISDLHFGLEDRQALGWFEARVREERPDAVLITGDLTMRARRREFDAACKWIRTLDVPLSVEVGNHDLPYFNPFARLLWPYRRIQRIRHLVEKPIIWPGHAIVPLKTTARAQWRLDWSKGVVSERALDKCLHHIDALPPGTQVLVTAHHPLVEKGKSGRRMTRGGRGALSELAARNVTAVLSGHVHDPFDMMHNSIAGPIRMVGAGTLSKRVRSTPASFNELRLAASNLDVVVRTQQELPSVVMRIDDVPPDALPPRSPDEAVAPIRAVPAEDPPVV